MGAASITDSGRSSATLTPRAATVTASALPTEHNEPWAGDSPERRRSGRVSRPTGNGGTVDRQSNARSIGRGLVRDQQAGHERKDQVSMPQVPRIRRADPRTPQVQAREPVPVEVTMIWHDGNRQDYDALAGCLDPGRGRDPVDHPLGRPPPRLGLGPPGTPQLPPHSPRDLMQGGEEPTVPFGSPPCLSSSSRQGCSGDGLAGGWDGGRRDSVPWPDCGAVRQ
jgi:hypothetical protein